MAVGYCVLVGSLLNSVVQGRDIEEVLAVMDGNVVAGVAVGVDDEAVEAVGFVGVVGALALAGLREGGAEPGVELVAGDGDLGAARLLPQVVGQVAKGALAR